MLDFIVRFVVPLSGIIAALVYGVLRLSYVLFYLHLRTTPEEVGYGYAEILSGQLLGALELVLLVGALFLAVSMSVRFALRLGERVRSHASQRPAVLSTLGGVGNAIVRSLAAAVIVVCVGLPWIAWQEGVAAAEGSTKRNIYLYPLPIPVLPVQAVPADIRMAAAEAEDLGLAGRACLMYLGQAQGTRIFYDVTTEESLRVAGVAMVVALRNTRAVPIGC